MPLMLLYVSVIGSMHITGNGEMLIQKTTFMAYLITLGLLLESRINHYS